MTGWTEERVAELKRLKAEGLSASQIAKALRPSGFVTRNAVIGKLNRLGLSKPKKRRAGRITGNRRAPILPDDIDGVAS